MSEATGGEALLETMKKQFGQRLQQLRKDAGLTLIALSKELNRPSKQIGGTSRPIGGTSKQRLSELEQGRFVVPPTHDLVEGFIARCAERRNAGRVLKDERTSDLRREYDALVRVLEAEEQRRSRGSPHQPPAGDPAAARPDDEWVRLVKDHVVWRRLAPGHDAEPLRQQAAAVAYRLSVIRDEAERALAGDPWRDRTLATRITTRARWLIEQAMPVERGDLSPAEAALIALLPLLHHAHRIQSAAGRLTVDPTNLAQTGAPDHQPRGKFERFLREHPMLVSRAGLPDLPGRARAGEEIGWWLFHRWLARRSAQLEPGLVDPLLREAVQDLLMSRVFDGKRVRYLLRVLRLAPEELRSTDRLELKKDELLFGGSQYEQIVRERLVGFLFLLAHALGIEVIALPSTIVEHLGIPKPVGLGQLHQTVNEVDWDLRLGGVGLTAQCHHEATLEALREHAARVDALLGAAHVAARGDTTLQALLSLPTRASAAGAQPAAGADGEPLFLFPGVRFRLDEGRVRELLMGEQLYRDRALAIRELYQNALDACRYREARQEFLRSGGRSVGGWQGEIRFEQRQDEDGRFYLECRDNGVGMGEAELRGVFSEAGARFADLTEFLEEQAEWAGHGVRLFPNSRFGIGVMSYFMLADEIEVTTCRMDRYGGRPGPNLKVDIVGPGHLFRIQRLAEHGEAPGTRVRLYLRDGQHAPSCVEALRKLLGIAEFATTARHGEQTEQWVPFVLSPRSRRSWEQDGIDAHGTLVHCARQAGGQVIWCEHGGALLVDGLYVRPSVRLGVLADPTDRGDLRGAVVNLSRDEQAPRLSVDRTLVLDDVSGRVEKLLGDTAGELARVEGPIPSFGWVCEVAAGSPRVADLVTRGVIEAGRRLSWAGRSFDPTVAGCFPPDRGLIEELLIVDGPPTLRQGARLPDGDGFGYAVYDAPDHIVLWRLLAHRADRVLKDLAVMVPERELTGPLLRAEPSDSALLLDDVWHSGSGSHWVDFDGPLAPGHLLWVAARVGVSPQDAARRAVALGARNVQPDRFSADPDLDTTDLALLSLTLDGMPGPGGWLRLGEPVLPGHLVAASNRHDLTTTEASERLAAYGFETHHSGQLPDHPDDHDLKLLSHNLDSQSPWRDPATSPWLDPATPVPPGHLILAAHTLDTSVSAVIARLAAYGFDTPHCGQLPDHPDDHDLRLLSHNLNGKHPWLDPATPVPPGHLIRAADTLGKSVPEVVTRLAACGFDTPHSDQLPDHPDDHDLKLLSHYLNGQSPWLDPATPVPPSHLILAADTLAMSMPEVVTRLAAYGFETHHCGQLPDHPGNHDLRLLSRDLDGRSQWLDPATPVPPAHLILAAGTLRMSVPEVVTRLAAYGFDTPHSDQLPDHPDDHDLKLLSRFLDGQLPWLEPAEPVSLHHLIRAAGILRRTLPEVANRLRELGMDVPDLVSSVAKALERVPRGTPDG